MDTIRVQTMSLSKNWTVVIIHAGNFGGKPVRNLMLHVRKFSSFLYFLTFNVLIYSYSYLEIMKNKYVVTNDISDSIRKEQYDFLLNIENYKLSIEYMITILIIFSLVVVLIYYRNNFGGFLGLQYAFVILFIIINFIVSSYSRASIGNLTQVIILPHMVTIIAILLRFILRMLGKIKGSAHKKFQGV